MSCHPSHIYGVLFTGVSSPHLRNVDHDARAPDSGNAHGSRLPDLLAVSVLAPTALHPPTHTFCAAAQPQSTLGKETTISSA